MFPAYNTRPLWPQQIFEFINDEIICACAIFSAAHTVICLFSPVQRYYNIAHFTIAEFYDFIIDQKTVRCDREPEILARFFFDRSAIRNQLLYDIPVQQRLTAEKVYFKIRSSGRVGHKIIDRCLSRFK